MAVGNNELIIKVCNPSNDCNAVAPQIFCRLFAEKSKRGIKIATQIAWLYNQSGY